MEAHDSELVNFLCKEIMVWNMNAIHTVCQTKINISSKRCQYQTVENKQHI